MKDQLSQSEDGIVAYFAIRIAHQSSKCSEQMRYERFQNAIKRFHANSQHAGAERLFRNSAILFLQITKFYQQDIKLQTI